MANVYVCDRCGKEIKDKYPLRVEYSIRRALLWFEHDDDDEIELCGACGAELDSWLKNGKRAEP